MTYQIINKSKDNTVAQKALMADTFFKRGLGLMFRKEMPRDEALIFFNAPSIHTFFMRFPIDIIFLDNTSTVIKVCHLCKSYRFFCCRRSTATLELCAGRAKETGTEVGDKLELVPRP